ncbi:MAG: hypothetical protein LPK21_08885 [Hymenobacteraceae bacterium]|nr:hypothetical protein [Hymenobacteraceae bacterium]MDX5512362.1 hypothetical protein [Hymenobacteraceae bacterium]
MKFISTKLHGVLDYVYGILLIAAPWVLNFDRGGAETWIPVAIGLLVLIQSVFTDYETGLLRKIPMIGHILFDIVAGLFLAMSPWIFNFYDFVWAPHLFFGVFSVLVASFTKTIPADRAL